MTRTAQVVGLAKVAPIPHVQAARAVSKVVEKAGEVLTGDIIVIRGKVYRRVALGSKAKDGFMLEPVDVEAHLNPIGIGIGLAGAALAALLGIIAWKGVKINLPLGGGYEIGGLKDALAEREQEKEQEADDRLNANCDSLEVRWNRLRSDPWWWLNPFVVGELQAIERDARLLGCAWIS